LDLTMMLDKEEQFPFPWVVNILDLQNVCVIWEYLRWDYRKLKEYLYTRIQLHGKIVSSDELDIVGYFVKHGSLEHLLTDSNCKTIISTEYAFVFDQIVRAKSVGPKF